jgi:DMSO/TMAO reductase YedYZ heme-binding membrane subunit
MSTNERTDLSRPERVFVGLTIASLVSLLPAGAAFASGATASATGATGAATDAGIVALHRTAALAGFLAYGLMVATVCWGILTTTHIARRGVRRQTLYGGHMTMAIMTISFLVIHIAANVFSPKAGLSVLNAVIPFVPGSSLAVSLGVVATELIIAIAASVWFQRRLGYRRWHALHWFAYPAYGLALTHTVMAGSDVHLELISTALVASLLCVVALFVLRALPATSLVRARVAPAEH